MNGGLAHVDADLRDDYLGRERTEVPASTGVAVAVAAEAAACAPFRHGY
jgi:hypothetical protein